MKPGSKFIFEVKAKNRKTRSTDAVRVTAGSAAVVERRPLFALNTMSLRLLTDGYDIDELAEVAASARLPVRHTEVGELYVTLCEGVQSMVASHAHINTRVSRCSALADNDVAGLHVLAAKLLHTETLAGGFATILTRSGSLLAGKTYTLLAKERAHKDIEAAKGIQKTTAGQHRRSRECRSAH